MSKGDEIAFNNYRFSYEELLAIRDIIRPQIKTIYCDGRYAMRIEPSKNKFVYINLPSGKRYKLKISLNERERKKLTHSISQNEEIDARITCEVIDNYIIKSVFTGIDAPARDDAYLIRNYKPLL